MGRKWNSRLPCGFDNNKNVQGCSPFLKTNMTFFEWTKETIVTMLWKFSQIIWLAMKKEFVREIKFVFYLGSWN